MEFTPLALLSTQISTWLVTLYVDCFHYSEVSDLIYLHSFDHQSGMPLSVFMYLHVFGVRITAQVY